MLFFRVHQIVPAISSFEPRKLNEHFIPHMWIDKSIKSNVERFAEIDEMAWWNRPSCRTRRKLKFFLVWVIKDDEASVRCEAEHIKENGKWINGKFSTLAPIDSSHNRLRLSVCGDSQCWRRKQASSRTSHPRMLATGSVARKKNPMSQIKNNSCYSRTIPTTTEREREQRQRHRELLCDRRQSTRSSSSSWKIEGVFEILFSPEFYLHKKKSSREKNVEHDDRVSVIIWFSSRKIFLSCSKQAREEKRRR